MAGTAVSGEILSITALPTIIPHTDDKATDETETKTWGHLMVLSPQYYIIGGQRYSNCGWRATLAFIGFAESSHLKHIFNRPGVAGAVLQTPPSLTD